MEFEFFVKGIIVGLSVSIPMGPIGVLCVQRTINKGRLSGFISGLGAAVADTIFAIIAGLGITFIINFLQKQQLFIQIFGSCFILYIGIKIFYTNPVKQFKKRSKKKNNLIEDFFSILLLTLSNPVFLFLFMAVFAGLNLVQEEPEYFSILSVISGVLIGASLWWFALSSFVNRFRRKFRLRRLWWINKISGGLIFLLGLVAVIKFVISYF